MPKYLVYDDADLTRGTGKIIDATSDVEARDKYIEERYGALPFIERTYQVVVSLLGQRSTRHEATWTVTYTSKPHFHLVSDGE